MRIVIPALLATGIGLSAAAQDGPGQFGQPYWIERPVLEALGRADLQVKPNRTSFSVAYKNTAKTAAEAVSLASDRAKAANAAMEQVAGEDLTITSNVSVTPIYEQYEDEEGNRVTNYSPDAIRAYEASVAFQVGIEDLAKASRTRAAALALGPESSSYFNNSLKRDTDILQAAQMAAIKDARERAGMMASAAGVSLGRLLVIQEGNGPCLGEWTDGDVGYTSYARSPAPPPPPPPPSPPAPGAQTVTQEDMDALDLPNTPATVSVRGSACLVYELK